MPRLQHQKYEHIRAWCDFDWQTIFLYLFLIFDAFLFYSLPFYSNAWLRYVRVFSVANPSVVCL